MKKICLILATIMASLVLLFTNNYAQAYTVDGDVAKSGSYTLTGSLWGVLTTAVINAPSPAIDQWIEGDYVKVTGVDGSMALFSVGELDPEYGNQTVLLSSNNNGGHNLSGSGRTVVDVARIRVVHAVDMNRDGIQSFSPRFDVLGSGIPAEKIYDLTVLQTMAQISFVAGDTSFTGPTLIDVLKDAGVDSGNMNIYVIIKSSDGFSTLLSMFEITNTIGSTPNLLAISASNHSLNEGMWLSTTRNGSSVERGDTGIARLVLTSDGGAMNKCRRVSNIKSIEVINAME